MVVTRAIRAATAATKLARVSALRGAALVPVGVVLVSELEMDEPEVVPLGVVLVPELEMDEPDVVTVGLAVLRENLSEVKGITM